MGLKILFLSHRFYPDVGGIEVNSEILATEFHRAGHCVRLLTWSKDRGQKQFAFEVRRNPGLVSVWNSYRWADVVYHNNPCMKFAWPSLFVQKPVVIALRTWIRRSDGNIGWRDRIKLRYLSDATAVIAVSEAVRVKCWSGAQVIPNPYRSAIFKMDPTIKERTGFVFLGRLVSDKGADLAIKVIGRLNAFSNAQTPGGPHEFSLTVIGEGPDRKELEELAGSLGVRSRVTFTGILNGTSLVSCLNRHRYIIVPSLWEEPFGNVALEGMACGCIPIVSDRGGLPEAIGDAGMVFASGDLAALSACISTLLDDRILESKLRKAAELHLEKHQPDLIARHYLSVINKAYTLGCA